MSSSQLTNNIFQRGGYTTTNQIEYFVNVGVSVVLQIGDSRPGSSAHFDESRLVAGYPQGDLKTDRGGHG